jgi:hypothetical protein
MQKAILFLFNGNSANMFGIFACILTELDNYEFHSPINKAKKNLQHKKFFVPLQPIKILKKV